jgi:hypothetical protein
MLDPATLSLLTAPRILALRIPRSGRDACLTSREDSIEGVEGSAATLRRAACARAASSRAGDDDGSSDDLDLEDLLDNPEAVCATLRVQTLPVAASIGGKVWDASLLMSTWIFDRALSAEHFPPPVDLGGRAPRLLELGSGLGLTGLAAALAFPFTSVTCSDYDPAVLDNLHATVRLNSSGPEKGPLRLDVTRVDFRDFAEGAPTSSNAHYASLLHQFDLLFAADVVYEQSHCALAQVCLALLKPAQPRGHGGGDVAQWQPRAIFMLPDSRPRLREFVDELAAAGLRCHIERVEPSQEMVRRLRCSHEGWGAGDATFSLYFVERAHPQ